MDVCNRKKLNQVDLLSPAKKRVNEREYWANARGNAAHGSRFTTDKVIIYEAAKRYLKEHADNGTLPSLKYIKSAPGKFVSLDKLKAKRSELIDKQKALRSKYYSAKNAEKEIYAIKRNVDNMLKEASLEKNRSHQRDKPII